MQQEDGDALECFPFDVNDYPLHTDETIGVDEIPKFENIGNLNILADAAVSLLEENSNDKGGVSNVEHVTIDLNVSLWPDGETP